MLAAVFAVAVVPVATMPVAQAQVCGPAAVSVGDYRQYEGTVSGTTVFTFTVVVAPQAGCSATGSVQYATEHLSTAPGDFTPVSGTLTWSGNPETKVVAVAVTPDSAPEPEEGFQVRVFDAAGLLVVKDRGRGQIVDDDLPAVQTTIDGGKICWSADGLCVFDVYGNCTAQQDITLRFRTVQTRAGKLGYVPVTDGVVVIRAGTSRGQGVVRLLPKAPTEPDETLVVEIYSPSAGTVAVSRGTFTIRAKR